jgi:hypothetical protein
VGFVVDKVALVPVSTQQPLSQKLALTSPTSGDCSVGVVCSRTKDTEINFFPASTSDCSKNSHCTHYVCISYPGPVH